MLSKDICEDLESCNLQGGVAFAEKVHKQCQIFFSKRLLSQVR